MNSLQETLSSSKRFSESGLTNTSSSEWMKTYQIKKSALQKSRIVQYGLSACLLLQCIGFLFIPASLGWSYLLNLFHFICNLGIAIFVILILVIYHPMKQVTKLFRESTDGTKLATSTSLTSSQLVNDPKIVKSDSNKEKEVASPISHTLSPCTHPVEAFDLNNSSHSLNNNTRDEGKHV